MIFDTFLDISCQILDAHTLKLTGPVKGPKMTLFGTS